MGLVQGFKLFTQRFSEMSVEINRKFTSRIGAIKKVGGHCRARYVKLFSVRLTAPHVFDITENQPVGIYKYHDATLDQSLAT